MERSTKPDWKYWNAYDLIEVWQAVALSIDRDPASIADHRKRLTSGQRRGPMRLFDGGPEFDKRLDILQSAYDRHPSQFVRLNDPNAGFRPFEEVKVFPEMVRDFFVSRGFDVPQEWRLTHSQPPEQASVGASQTNSAVPSGRWPWGDYETKLLGVLAEAVREWWSTYDPTDPAILNPPRQPEISAWIEKRLTKLGYSNPGTLAKYMATIIRHDGAPLGRRKQTRGE